MLIYSSYTPCNLLEKKKNSLKFFGRLMDSYVRGIEVKLNVKQTNTQATGYINAEYNQLCNRTLESKG